MIKKSPTFKDMSLIKLFTDFQDKTFCSDCPALSMLLLFV